MAKKSRSSKSASRSVSKHFLLFCLVTILACTVVAFQSLRLASAEDRVATAPAAEESFAREASSRHTAVAATAVAAPLAAPPPAQASAAGAAPSARASATGAAAVATAPKPRPVAAVVATSSAEVQPDPLVHLCFCSDDPDLRPLAAAINSTLAHARHPGRLVFHIITDADGAARVPVELRPQLSLGKAKLLAHHNEALQAEIRELIRFRASSGARKKLATPFNFAAFYLERFLSGSGFTPGRLIYMDTDVILKADVEELLDLELHGHAVAAVEDCSQHFEMYINFEAIEKKGFQRQDLDPKACVFNRGIFVLDVARWRELRITEDIELWMRRYNESAIYKFGMSQPPWLLALSGRYERLGAEWNCRGLGRPHLDSKEYEEVKSALGLNKPGLKALKVKTQGEFIRPFIAPCAASAKLLHFNGAMKPWRRDKWQKGQRKSVCARQGRWPLASADNEDVAGVRGRFTYCAYIWDYYLSPTAAERLRGTAPLASVSISDPKS